MLSEQKEISKREFLANFNKNMPENTEIQMREKDGMLECFVVATNNKFERFVFSAATFREFREKLGKFDAEAENARRHFFLTGVIPGL